MTFGPVRFRGRYEPTDPICFTLRRNRFSPKPFPAASPHQYTDDGMGGNLLPAVDTAGVDVGGRIVEVRSRAPYCGQ